MSDYRHGSHTTFSIHLHIVWITKYRHKVLRGEVAERVRAIVREECQKARVDILQGHIAPDHVHVMISIPPHVTKYNVRDVVDEFCMSPYPSDPWKFDWMKNPGRMQPLTGTPFFYRGTDENYWARGPLAVSYGVNGTAPTSQDFLHAYWLGRATAVFAPSD